MRGRYVGDFLVFFFLDYYFIIMRFWIKILLLLDFGLLFYYEILDYYFIILDYYLIIMRFWILILLLLDFA